MFKILILAYLIGQDPIATQQTFELKQSFESMEACKQELTLQSTDNGTYDVTWDFVNHGNFEWDWLAFGCINQETGEEFVIEPTYPLGKPDELQGVRIKDRGIEV